MKRLISMLLIAGLSVLVLSGCGQSQKKETNVAADAKKEQAADPLNWSLGTSSSGSGPYVSGVIMTKTINTDQNIVKIAPQVTGGFNENIKLVNDGNIHLGITVDQDLADAYEGKGIFNGKKHENLRKLFTYNIVVMHVVSRESSGIKKLEDLQGKKFNVGMPSMTTRILNEDLLKAANIDFKNIKPFELSTGDSFTAIQDGVIDVTSNGYDIGYGKLIELANSVPIRLIPIPDDVFNRMNKIRNNALIKVSIPANTYKGQKEDIPTYAIGMIMFAKDNADEKAVYQVTKGFWDNLKKLQEEPSFKNLKLDYAVSEGPVPLHPGAQKYFKEVGLIK